MTIPPGDLEMAWEKGLLFEVAMKPSRGQKWEAAGEKTHSLEEALARAKGLVAFQSAIFVLDKHQAGTLYWSSDDPDLYNSTVIEYAGLSRQSRKMIGAMMDREVFELMDGDVRVWIEQETIHMIATDRGIPVELTAFMARELATALLRMADLTDE